MPKISHISILVKSVDKAAKKFSALGLFANQPEEFEEGRVLEIYIGDYKLNSALPLLQQPVKTDCYARAFKKTGWGLHHIAIDVPDLEKYTDDIHDSGWMLHPWSIEAAKKLKTIYLCHPDLDFIIEVQQPNRISDAPPLIQGITLTLTDKTHKLMSTLGISDFVTSGKNAELIFSNSRSIRIEEL